MSRTELAWFELRFPHDLTVDAVIAFLSALSGAAYDARFILDLSATSNGIRHRLAVSQRSAEQVLAHLRAAAPSLTASTIDAPDRVQGRRWMWQLAPTIGALRATEPAATSAALLASLYPLDAAEHISLRWHLRSGARPRLDVASEAPRQGQTMALRQKHTHAGLSAYSVLSVRAGERRRAWQLIQRVGAVLRSVATPHGRLVSDPFWLGHVYRALAQRGRYFSVAELATILGWPIDGPDLPGLELGASRRLVPAAQLAEAGRVLGTSNFAGIERTVAISPTASTRGLHILGPTGTGKTSIIKNLVGDSLRAGGGLAVVETNGDLIQDILDLIPPNRINDVVLLDPTDENFAVGFNPFAGAGDPALVADQIGELFQRLWQRYWGPRTAQLAHMGLLTLAQRPGSTLVDLPRVFLDKGFRRQVVAQLDDPVGLAPDWAWFERLQERDQAAVIAPLMNKVRQFTARKAIRPIIGQSDPATSIQRIVAEGKVLLVHIPKGLIGSDTAQLLGCLVLTSLWQAASERARLAVTDRAPFNLYVDEVQDFAASPIPWEEVFAQGRKYALAVSVAHQNLDQLPRELREVILANARSKVVFSLSASDAATMEREFAPALKASDLQSLDPYTIAARVALDDGSTSRPVTLQTPSPPTPLGSREAVRAASRANYGRPRGEVERTLRQAAAGGVGSGRAIGRAPRRPS